MGDISKFVKISGTLSILLGVSSCSVVLNRTVLSEPEKPLVTNPAEAPTEPSAAASDTANLPAESRTNPAPREAAAIPEADKLGVVLGNGDLLGATPELMDEGSTSPEL